MNITSNIHAGTKKNLSQHALLLIYRQRVAVWVHVELLRSVCTSVCVCFLSYYMLTTVSWNIIIHKQQHTALISEILPSKLKYVLATDSVFHSAVNSTFINAISCGRTLVFNITTPNIKGFSLKNKTANFAAAVCAECSRRKQSKAVDHLILIELMHSLFSERKVLHC